MLRMVHQQLLGHIRHTEEAGREVVKPKKERAPVEITNGLRLGAMGAGGIYMCDRLVSRATRTDTCLPLFTF